MQTTSALLVTLALGALLACTGIGSSGGVESDAAPPEAPGDERVPGAEQPVVCVEDALMCSGPPPTIEAPGYNPVGANLVICSGGTWVLKENCTVGQGTIGCYERDGTAYCGEIGD